MARRESRKQQEFCSIAEMTSSDIKYLLLSGQGQQDWNSVHKTYSSNRKARMILERQAGR